MTEEKKKYFCDTCGVGVESEWDLDRWGDCKSCHVKTMEKEMCVGDINNK